MSPTVAIIAPGNMGAGVGRRLTENKVPVLTSLTGRSEGAVKVMQHRALGALARLLGGSRSRRPANHHEE